MATYIETSSVAGTTTPTTAGAIIRDQQFGIDSVLDGYIIQSMTVSKTRTFDPTYDQKNCLVSELDTDEETTVSLTIVGGAGDANAEDGKLTGIEVGDTNFVLNGHTWKVRAIAFNGSYADKKSFSIDLFRSAAFPSQG